MYKLVSVDQRRIMVSILKTAYWRVKEVECVSI